MWQGKKNEKKWKLKHKIKPSKIDEAVIRKVILDKRLGPACLEATIKNISTQGNEAFNRILSKSSYDDIAKIPRNSFVIFRGFCVF